MENLDAHSGELLILILFTLVMVTLLVLVPRLLQAHQRALEIQQHERIHALDQGHPLPPPVDERCQTAGRTAMLVPMVVIISAGTVTCFLVAYKSEYLFSVALAVWCVSGVVSLAAITGGVALIGRLAQLNAEEADEENPSHPLLDDPKQRPGAGRRA